MHWVNISESMSAGFCCNIFWFLVCFMVICAPVAYANHRLVKLLAMKSSEEALNLQLLRNHHVFVKMFHKCKHACFVDCANVQDIDTILTMQTLTHAHPNIHIVLQFSKNKFSQFTFLTSKHNFLLLSFFSSQNPSDRITLATLKMQSQRSPLNSILKNIGCLHI